MSPVALSTPAAAFPAPASASTLRAVGRTRWVALGCLWGLIVLGVAWELWLASWHGGGAWWALKVLPLWLPLAGIARHRMYTYRWVSLLVWVYFTEGTVRAWSDTGPSAALAGVEVVLCLVLFVTCALHVRIRLRAAGAQAIALDKARHAGPSEQVPSEGTGAAADLR